MPGVAAPGDEPRLRWEPGSCLFETRKSPGLPEKLTVGVPGVEPGSYKFLKEISADVSQTSDEFFLGLPGVEPGSYAPHAYILPLYYSPRKNSSPCVYTTVVLHPRHNISSPCIYTTVVLHSDKIFL